MLFHKFSCILFSLPYFLITDDRGFCVSKQLIALPTPKRCCVLSFLYYSEQTMFLFDKSIQYHSTFLVNNQEECCV